MIKIGLRFNDVSDPALQRAAQIGAHGGPIGFQSIPGAMDGTPDAAALRQIKNRFESWGLELAGMELGRPQFAGVLHGDAERARPELARLVTTLEVLGDLGLPLVNIGFSVARADLVPRLWPGYSSDPNGRAGTQRRTFDASRLADADNVTWGTPNAAKPGVLVTRDEHLRRMDVLMDAILPVAERHSLRLAFHPNDPPLSIYRGVEQPFINPNGLDELLTRYSSPSVGLLYCMGTMYESGADMTEGLRRFGARGKLFCLHFRNVIGKVPNFQEVFPDEGNHDPVEHIRLLHAIDYSGFLLPDHYPGILGDDSTHELAETWCVAYFRALIQATRPILSV